jgi:hypothetical protein
MDQKFMNVISIAARLEFASSTAADKFALLFPLTQGRQREKMINIT